MGRFASTVEFYTRCREPYPPEFFQTVAERLALQGDEALLDVGCGPGPLAIGFAPFVGSCTGLDSEADMIKAARAAAESVACVMVTLGRALHWLDRDTTIQVLERIVSERGHVLICGATSIEVPQSEWLKPYLKICNSWSDDPERKRYRIEAQEWFAGSRFSKLDDISVTYAQHVSIDDLIGRALSKSNTSLSVVGRWQAEFEAAIRAVLEPFSQDGVLEEEIVARAAIFGRPA
jgi:cyclopropane fatty-acyl-phospholipid synthase-like methyltransferase